MTRMILCLACALAMIACRLPAQMPPSSARLEHIRKAPQTPNSEREISISVEIDSVASPFRIRATPSEPIGTKLLAYANSTGTGQPMFTYGDGDRLLYMSQPWPYSELLISVWEGGDHSAIRVFRITASKVDVVFEAQTPTPAEVIGGPGESIVVVRAASKTRDAAKVYIWNGSEYALLGTVPFEERYRAIQEWAARSH